MQLIHKRLINGNQQHKVICLEVAVKGRSCFCEYPEVDHLWQTFGPLVCFDVFDRSVAFIFIDLYSEL